MIFNYLLKISPGMTRNTEERGDTAFEEYSEKFDKWTSKSSKLSKEKIQACYERA